MPKKVAGGIDNNGQRLRGVGTPTATDDGVPKSFLRYDLAFFCAGKPGASEQLMGFIAPVAFTVPAGFSTSQVYAGAAATNSAVFPFLRNGTQVGTITFAAGATVPTLSLASALNVALADRLACIGPSTQDATLADIYFAIVGIR